MRIDLTLWRRGAGALALTIAGLGLMAAPGAQAQPVAGAVYVSPGGSDANSGLTPDQPFATLEHAREVMRASPVKVAYLEGGVYPRTASLALTAPDAGESWLAMPGQTPILDGGGTTKRGFVIRTSHITIRWLTIQNFVDSGIFSENAADLVIDSNTVKNIQANAWSQGAIVNIGRTANARVTHNFVQNSQYAGILFGVTGNDTTNGVLIQDNVVLDTCTKIADCGAIYADDRAHATTGIRIDHNIVGRYGSLQMNSKGVYLDDLLSNTTVTNNIIYGNGRFAIQVHGGDHNLIQNNIFDVRQASAGVLYQLHDPLHLMEGNVFRCNIFYYGGAGTQGLWNRLETGVPATEDRNIYWNAAQGRANFVDPDGRNYALRSEAAAAYCGFKPISTVGVGPLPNP